MILSKWLSLILTILCTGVPFWLTAILSYPQPRLRMWCAHSFLRLTTRVGTINPVLGRSAPHSRLTVMYSKYVVKEDARMQLECFARWGLSRPMEVALFKANVQMGFSATFLTILAKQAMLVYQMSVARIPTVWLLSTATQALVSARLGRHLKQVVVKLKSVLPTIIVSQGFADQSKCKRKHAGHIPLALLDIALGYNATLRSEMEKLARKMNTVALLSAPNSAINPLTHKHAAQTKTVSLLTTALLAISAHRESPRTTHATSQNKTVKKGSSVKEIAVLLIRVVARQTLIVQLASTAPIIHVLLWKEKEQTAQSPLNVGLTWSVLARNAQSSLQLKVPVLLTTTASLTPVALPVSAQPSLLLVVCVQATCVQLEHIATHQRVCALLRCLSSQLAQRIINAAISISAIKLWNIAILRSTQEMLAFLQIVTTTRQWTCVRHQDSDVSQTPAKLPVLVLALIATNAAKLSTAAKVLVWTEREWIKVVKKTKSARVHCSVTQESLLKYAKQELLIKKCALRTSSAI